VTWTLDNLREKQVQHLVDMALKRGWIAYAKARAQELENDQSGLFKGIVEEVRERLNERK
jgi:hypothetical protein